jgi:hypothetical protein
MQEPQWEAGLGENAFELLGERLRGRDVRNAARSPMTALWASQNGRAPVVQSFAF